ncbi:HNH endonuclease family protein [Streptomyces sp. NPDC090106]|uniref:HNH endonuclease family protein n=1 Tax=Streptomyces sp. NPDC090106 TaxID=3365946 RepID=UPI00382312F7
MTRRTTLLPTTATALALTLALSGCAGLIEEATSSPQPSATASPAASGAPGADATAGAGGGAGAGEGLALADAIGQLTIEPETSGGYVRSSFKHWNSGQDAGDGCDTREELLIAEAVTAPETGTGCKLTGGSWFSYYDEVTVTNARGLDVDHIVPLEEAWSSGASQWDAARREAYANDLDAERSLVAVTAKTNRSKGAKDPAQWLPPADSALCTYLEDWTATKLRWNLTADTAEQAALTEHATQCPDSTITYTPAT